MNLSICDHEFDWDHYAQVELRHRMAMEAMEASLHDAQAVVTDEVRTGWLGLVTRIPFGKKDRVAHEAAVTVMPEIRKRLIEEREALRMNELSRHAALHRWLLAQDAAYGRSVEFDAIYAQIAVCAEELLRRLTDLLARYGHARTEIAISFDHRTGHLSEAALASVDRLIASYSGLYRFQDMLRVQLDRLNALAEGTMFLGLKLCRFDQVQPPECRHGVRYAELHEALLAGVAGVQAAITQLDNHLRSIRNKSVVDRILREYRDEVWAAYLETGLLRAPEQGLARAA